MLDSTRASDGVVFLIPGGEFEDSCLYPPPPPPVIIVCRASETKAPRPLSWFVYYRVNNGVFYRESTPVQPATVLLFLNRSAGCWPSSIRNEPPPFSIFQILPDEAVEGVTLGFVVRVPRCRLPPSFLFE